MVDKDGGSLVLTQLQDSFLWDSNDKGLSPYGQQFFCLPTVLQIEVKMYMMASDPAYPISIGMLYTPSDFPIYFALTPDSTSSRRIE